MLEIYEGRNKDRKLVRKMQGEIIGVEAISGYLVWLQLLAEGKTVLQLYVSPHQMGRLGKYLSSTIWQGGIICPMKTQPDYCYITELNDKAKYEEILKDIKRRRESLGDYPEGIDVGIRKLNDNWKLNEIVRLEAEAEILRGSMRFGLTFTFSHTNPEMEIEWLPDDVKVEAERFLEIAKLAYDLREPEIEVKTDLTEWKRKLFEV